MNSIKLNKSIPDPQFYFRTHFIVTDTNFEQNRFQIITENKRCGIKMREK